MNQGIWTSVPEKCRRGDPDGASGGGGGGGGGGVLNGGRNEAMEDTMTFNFATKFVHKTCQRALKVTSATKVFFARK